MPVKINQNAQWEHEAIHIYKSSVCTEMTPNKEGYFEPPLPITSEAINVNGEYYRFTDDDKKRVLQVFTPQRDWTAAIKEHGRGSYEEYHCRHYKCYDLARYFCIGDILIRFWISGEGCDPFRLSEAPEFLQKWFQGPQKPMEYFLTRPY